MTTEQGLQNALAMLAFYNGKPVECSYLLHGVGAWIETGGPTWDFDTYAYRPRPEPVTRPWSSGADVPSNCWLQSSACLDGECFCAIGIYDTGLWIIRRDSVIPWEELARCWKYSIDRKQWRKCEVTES